MTQRLSQPYQNINKPRHDYPVNGWQPGSFMGIMGQICLHKETAVLPGSQQFRS